MVSTFSHTSAGVPAVKCDSKSLLLSNFLLLDKLKHEEGWEVISLLKF